MRAPPDRACDLRWPRPRPATIALLCSALALAACGGGEGDDPKQTVQQECLPNKEYFRKEVWRGVMEMQCFACHNVAGQAKHSKLVLQPTSQTGYNEANMEAFRQASRYQADGQPLLLRKPLGELGHQGGAILKADSPEYKALEAMIARQDNPVECPDTLTVQGHYEKPGVQLMDARETLRKATLHLNGRLPTAQEEALVQAFGLDALDKVIHGLSQEDAFYERLEELFNDMLLTNRYLGNTRAVDLLDRRLFPDARWFNEMDRDVSGMDPTFVERGRRVTNDAVAQEPLKLISHVVRQDRPFTEILTADYILLNPYSAFVYGVKDVDWSDPLDPNEWREARIQEQTHAGLLSSPMFLNRFPTTPTNRNRHRARIVYDYFLATDVMSLAERPLDPTSIEDFNPAMYNPACVSCHAVIDPVAGAFQNWNERGMYSPPQGGWFEDMRPPGFEQTALPFAQRAQSLSWLADQIARDKRFATATLYNLYRGLTGHDILNPLETDAARYEQLALGQEVQQRFFEEATERFIQSDYNLKTAIALIVKSPYFRLKNLDEQSSPQQRLQHSHTGAGRLLTPELLHRKIAATTGTPWSHTFNREQYPLLRANDYRILYGGIDSDGVTQRITSPNGIMANIQWRMATEVSCRTTAADFTRVKASRKMFPFVEPGFAPEDDNGFVIQESVNAIRKNLQHLHWVFWGEQVTLEDPELTRTYHLFYDTWKEGKALVAEGKVSRDLMFACRADRDPDTNMELPEASRVRADPNYTLRAWQAVIAYMLTDYKFLHE